MEICNACDGKVMAITITLNDIRKYDPPTKEWGMLLRHLSKSQADDEPLKFSTIIKRNTTSFAYWCVDILPGEYERDKLLLCADLAERTLHIFERKYPGDDKPRKAIQATRDYANGLITGVDYDAIKDAAKESFAIADRAIACDIDSASASRAADATCYVCSVFEVYEASLRAAEQSSDEEKAQGELLVRYFG
jgi:hypothetical protein